ncbi:hypothetical protein DRP05_12260 [Archaeoglobales archaeon]|nr:MAG: hypothetical protein DRP05_12260 [Archaeoglobales archaeon]
MKFEIILKKRATKNLKKLSKTDRIRIFKTIERLEDPFSLDIRKLRDIENTYAVRVGNFRIVFKISSIRKSSLSLESTNEKEFTTACKFYPSINFNLFIFPGRINLMSEAIEFLKKSKMCC